MKDQKPVLIVGNGNMATAYAKVLNELAIPFVVAGRNIDKIKDFATKNNASGMILLTDLTSIKMAEYRFSIVTVSIEALALVTETLLNQNAKFILVEKPAVLNIESALKLAALAKKQGAVLRVALNRRFYSSVNALKQILLKEPPVCAFFDFTDNGKSVANAHYVEEVKKHWAWSNSVHVIGTAEFLLGKCSDINTKLFGKDELSWHPNAGTFQGTLKLGSTPTSYLTSWVCPGRWNIEIMTKQGRYKLSPMEKLQVMPSGQFQWVDVPIDSDKDVRFKPGIYEMVKSFNQVVNEKNDDRFPDYFEYVETMKMIATIAGY